MVGCGAGLAVREAREGEPFRPGFASWALALVATALVLYSFVGESDAALRGELPAPYHYELLAIGLVLYTLSFAIGVRR
jgi:hypothetical protein